MQRSPGALVLLLCSIAGACGDSGAKSCDVNADCDSNFCKADGTCGPAQSDDADVDDGMPDGPSGLCTPNHDGNITLPEIPLVAGKMARFRVALEATFDTTGTAQGDGSRVWDLSGTLSNDADAAIALLAPTGQYWAADFTASYATRLGGSDNDLLGVYHLDEDKLTLLGIVSPTTGTSGTNVSYDPPVTILDLPVTAGATWTSTGNVVGTYEGSYVNYDETYTSSVDKTGTMKTPYGDFPVLRVSTLLDQTAIVFPYTSFGKRRSFAWLAECFGSVANVTSQNLDDAAEIEDAAEVRRLVP